MEIIDGKIRWFHRNEKGETVFSAESANDVIKAKKWHEVAVTYSADEGVSRIFCDGAQLKEEISDKMVLSQDWGAFAGLLFIPFTTSYYYFYDLNIVFFPRSRDNSSYQDSKLLH